jgi:hypothetical protein
MFRLCGGDQRYARWMSGRFLKKATEKLPDRLAVKSPINPNLSKKLRRAAKLFCAIKQDLRADLIALIHSQKLEERNAKGIGNFIENGYVGAGPSLLPLRDRLRRNSDACCQIILRKTCPASGICDLFAQKICVYHLLTPCAIAHTPLCNRGVRFFLRINRRKEPWQKGKPLFARAQLRGEFAVSIACENH